MSEKALTDISFELPAEVDCPSCKEMIDVHGVEAFAPVECPHCAKTFPLPVQFGSFILLEQLAHGGMGAVFRAHDSALKRPVAIKVMRRKLGNNEEFVTQFEREAQKLARLNDPNVVQVYSAGKEQGQPYIVMELVDRGRLSDLIKPGKGLSETFVLTSAIDVIRGLKAASDIGLAHGDMKPENILFDRKERAKVVDFGLARFKGEEFQPGVIWGTPYYIAPEVVRGKQPNMQSDIYSLGCTLYYALTGVRPFDRTTMEETVAARLREKARDIRQLRPDIRPETAAIVERMMEVDLVSRYPNYKSLLDDLSAAATASGKAAAASSSVRKPSGHPWRYALTIATALIVLAAWIITKHNRKTAPQQPGKTIVIKTTLATNRPASRGEPNRPAKTKPATASARRLADDAAAYENWTDGSDGGAGFGPWTLRCGSTASGFFAGSCDANAGTGRINTSGKAWGMFASAGETAEAWRPLAGGPLEPGRERLRIDFDHGHVDSGGIVGLGLQNASSNNLWELYFVGGAEHYVVRDAEGERDSGIPFSSESLLVEFRLTSATEYSAAIVAGMSTFRLKGSLIEQADPAVRVIHLWNHSAGAGSEYDIYFNNLSVGPIR